MTEEPSPADAPFALDPALRRRLEQGALGEVFDEHRERLWRMVRFRMDRRLTARLDPDDIVQEAFVDASQRLHHYLANPTCGVFVWLRWVVGQTMIDVHRRHLGAQMRDAGRDLRLGAPAFPQATSACLAAELLASATSPSQAVARAEVAEQLERAIASMAPLDQEIIALRHFEDLTNAEVAEVLALQPTAASNRYVRAIARLKELLSGMPGF